MDKREAKRVKQTLLNFYSDLKFDEESHLYLINDKSLISGTQWVSKYKPEFDANGASFGKAKSIEKKFGLHVRKERIQEIWSIIRDNACANGTEVHKLNENKINDGRSSLKGSPYEKALLAYYKHIAGKIQFICSELRVYDESIGVAGTLDKLYYNNEKGCYGIGDWKTSKDKNKEGYNNKKMKPPFKHIGTGNYFSWSMQLSLYKYILEKTFGLEIGELSITWLKPPVIEHVYQTSSYLSYYIQDEKGRNIESIDIPIRSILTAKNTGDYAIEGYDFTIPRDLVWSRDDYFTPIGSNQIEESTFEIVELEPIDISIAF